jgi:enoyl-CoA hydratase/carnithine racemase
MNRHWQERQDEDGILWLGLDYADGPVNVLSRAVIEELDQLLDGIARDPPAALVIQSLKGSGFIAGADVHELSAVPDASTAGAHIRWVHGVFDRLDALPCPTLAMIHGFCLGGGLELALACRYRVASDFEGTRIGFPEVKLGIFPGYGGTFRAIRTLGAPAAMEIMLSGRLLRPSQARRLGLVDVTAPRRQLEAAARDLLARRPEPAPGGGGPAPGEPGPGAPGDSPSDDPPHPGAGSARALPCPLRPHRPLAPHGADRSRAPRRRGRGRSEAADGGHRPQPDPGLQAGGAAKVPRPQRRQTRPGASTWSAPGPWGPTSPPGAPCAGSTSASRTSRPTRSAAP